MNYPFRLGATSYVMHGDLVENAAFLAAGLRNGGRYPGHAGMLPPVSHMQLVLFDVPDGPSNVPDASTVARLAAIGRDTGLDYTVHLLEDLVADVEGGPAGQQATAQGQTVPAAWQSARAVMARTAPLCPSAYIAHLEAKPLRAAGYGARPAWEESMAATLQHVAAWSGGAARLAVENLEGYPPDLVAAPAALAGASRCVDVGHLWLDGEDPLRWLEAAVRPSVIHLHGVGYDPARQRVADHLALDHTPAAQLDAVCGWLLARGYRDVVTLEVFGPDDFVRSLQAFQAAWQRVAAYSGG